MPCPCPPAPDPGRRRPAGSRRRALAVVAAVALASVAMVAAPAPGPAAAADPVVAAAVGPLAGAQVAGVTRQPGTGALVVAGWRPGQVVLARVAPDGRADPTFGRQGTTVTPVPGLVADAGGLWGDPVADVVAAPDGRLLVLAGADRPDGGAPCLHGAVVLRYTADGRPDPSFGDGGRVVDGWGCDAHPRALAVRGDGSVVAAGIAIGDPGHGTVVARYRPDGSRDPGFGRGGLANLHWVAEPAGGAGWLGERVEALAVQADGAVVVVGARDLGASGAAPERSDALVARLDAAGRPDAGFADGGAAVIDLGGRVEELRTVTVAPSGAVTATGRSDAHPVVVRLTPDGLLDPTSVGDGVAPVPPPAPGGGTVRAWAARRTGRS